MSAPGGLFGCPLILRDGAARAWAVRQLIANGHAIDPRLRGASRVLALYTDRDCKRGALLRRLPSSGRVSVQRFGRLTARETAFLHTLESTVPDRVAR